MATFLLYKGLHLEHFVAFVALKCDEKKYNSAKIVKKE